MIKSEIITSNLIPELEEFCFQAKLLGYTNNSSIKKMNFLWCKSVGEYWCVIKDNEIIGVGGCHPLPEISPKAWRILYRGCELPKTDTFKGLGKGDWNSVTQRYLIPEFINWCPSEEIYVTTNTTNEHSGKALRNHKIQILLSKQKNNYIDKVCDIKLHGINQTVWKLNIETYLKRRSLLNTIK